MALVRRLGCPVLRLDIARLTPSEVTGLILQRLSRTAATVERTAPHPR
ncbi:hypothetical protein ABZ114_14935 [Streptomyces albidoflavus]